MIQEDPKFEIQYLISLIVLLIGAATTDYIKEFTSIHLVFLLLIIIIIHILLFNVSYTIQNVTPFQLSEGSTLYNYSRHTLVLVTLLFLLFIMNIISTVAYSTIPAGTDEIATFLAFLMTQITSDTLRILFIYVAPTLITVVIGLAGRSVLSTIDTARDIEIIVTPRELDIYSNFEDSKPLSVNIINHSEGEVSLQVKMASPESVELKQAGQRDAESGDFSESIHIPPKRQKRYDLQFRYMGDDKVARKLPIEVTYEGSTRTEEVEAILSSQ